MGEDGKEGKPLSHNFGDSIGLVGLILTAILYALTPSLPTRCLSLGVGVVLSVYLVYRSHFFRNWTPKTRHLAAVAIVVVLLVVGSYEFMPWRTGLTPDTQALVPSASPVGKTPERVIGTSKPVQQVPVIPRLKSKPVPSPPAVAVAPTYQQSCVGSACAQGPGAQATFNQFGNAKLILSDQQMTIIAVAMKAFSGTKVRVIINISDSDSEAYGERLALALEGAGLIAIRSKATANFAPGVKAHGLSFAFTEDHRGVAEKLAQVMKDSGAVEKPVPLTKLSFPEGFLDIAVQPN